jgi:hypothetical protein
MSLIDDIVSAVTEFLNLAWQFLQGYDTAGPRAPQDPAPRFVICASLLTFLGGCSPTFQATVQPQSTQLQGLAGLGEMRVQGAAPGASGCKSGGVLVTSGGGTTPSVFRTASIPVGGPLAATTVDSASLQLNKTDNFISADNHVLRLQDGTLYISWLYSSSAPLAQKPTWWDAVAGPPNNLPAGSRGSMLQLTSTNCGNSWTRLPDLDSAVVADGYWGWPQGTGDDNKAPWVGGWDRQEVYADPFTGRLYATIRATTSTLPGYTDHSDDAYLLFYSGDGGKNWTLSPIRFPAWEPLSMTTTPSGRLFLAHCMGTEDGTRLSVSWVDPKDLGGNSPTGSTIIANGTGKFDECGTLPQDKLPVGVTFEYLSHVSLSRIGANSADSIRITYPRVEDGKQVSYVMGLSFGADGNPLLVPLNVVRAHDDGGAVLFASFIESDGPEAKQTNVAVLYWLETTGAGTIVTRYAVVKDGWEWTSPADLSLAGGVRADWKPDGSWIGHYIRGGFHADANGFYYVALWPENGVPTMNMVTVERAVATSAPQKPAQWGNAKPAPLGPALKLRVLKAPQQDRDGVLRGSNSRPNTR